MVFVISKLRSLQNSIRKLPFSLPFAYFPTASCFTISDTFALKSVLIVRESYCLVEIINDESCS